MFVRRLVIENVRSFLERREMVFDGPLSIIIGPNGGGKTNFLDTLATVLRRYLASKRYLTQQGTENNISIWYPSEIQNMQSMSLERHSQGSGRDQFVEIEIEVSQQDAENLRTIKQTTPELLQHLNTRSRRINNSPWAQVDGWSVDQIVAGKRFTFAWTNWNITSELDPASDTFLSYIRLFEMDSVLRAEFGMPAMSSPLLYLPVQRATNGFVSGVTLSSFDEAQQRQTIDVTTSRVGSSIMSLAIGRLAKVFRLLQEENNTDARVKFERSPMCSSITAALQKLGYVWELETTNALTNQYSIRLTKQGASFLVEHASSGEKEILNYIFAVYALEVRNAIVVVDEPELHLHPRWQKVLVDLFEQLSRDTGNQFVMATHSPTFVSPSSIEYVSRIFSVNQQSQIVRLNSKNLPASKHLFNLINSHNNERLFFTNKVVLVEGITDRLVFEKIFEQVYATAGMSGAPDVEVINIGGKGVFDAYSLVLDASQIDYSIIADFDYIEQIGSADLKGLFTVNAREIKDDVVDNVKSFDGKALACAIDEGLSSLNFDRALPIWRYIQSKRRVLKAEISTIEKRQIETFIQEKRGEGIFLLSEGALEDYLPDGFRSKDVQKLVDFVSIPDILGRVKPERKNELEAIAKAILRI